VLQFKGDCYDGNGSKKTEVRLVLDSNGLLNIFAQETGKLLYCFDQQRITVSSRLGNSPRYLNLPEGQTVETLDNESIDLWLKQYRRSFISGLVHRLESNLKFVIEM